MQTRHPKLLFSKEIGSNAFNGIMISRQRGDLFLMPIQEITWVEAVPLGEKGYVEIQTRHHLVRLGMSRAETCLQFVELLFKGSVSRITEGSMQPVAEEEYAHHHPGSSGAESGSPTVTLVVEIIDLHDEKEKTRPDSSSLSALAGG